MASIAPTTGERVTQSDLSGSLEDDISLEDDDNDLVASNRNISFALAHQQRGTQPKTIFGKARRWASLVKFDWRSKGFFLSLLGHAVIFGLIWFFVHSVLWKEPILRCSAISSKLLWVVIVASTLCVCSLISSILIRCSREADLSEESITMELALLDGADTSTSNPNSGTVSSASRIGMCFRALFSYGLVIALLLSLLLGIAALFVRMQASPSAGGPIEGLLLLPGLRDRVWIKRDSFGVLHIEALNSHDMFLAQGFAMAQARLFQMELTRHAGRGLLSASLGDVALPVDREMRTLGLARLAARTSAFIAQTFPEEFALLEAFCRGVNEYITQATLLPIEFTLTGLKPKPYLPADVLLLCKLMAFDLAGNPNDELRRYLLVKQSGMTTAEVDSRWPRYNYTTWPSIVGAQDMNATYASLPSWLLDLLHGRNQTFEFASSASAEPSDKPKRESETTAEEWRWQRPWDVFWRRSGPARHASNNWAVSGRLTQSGKPLLASDPHLHWQLPSLWMLMHIHDNTTGMHAVGAALAGAPGVIIGRNEHIAWGITNVGTDVVDLVEISPVEGREGFYWFHNEPRPLRFRTERIAVRGAADVLVNVTLTDFGPVVNDIWDLPKGLPLLSMRWSLDPDQAQGAEDTTLVSMARLLHAKNFSAFRSALHLWTAPASNIVYADLEGNIGYQCTGRVPVRPLNDSDASGEWPTTSRSASSWSPQVPPEALPFAFNPAEGFVVSANNAVAPPEYPVPLLSERDWDVGYRATRIRSVLSAAKTAARPLTLADMQSLQQDQVSLVAHALRPLLDRAVALTDLQTNANLSAWLQRLRAWDGDLSSSKPEALVYQKWFLELGEAVRGRWSRLANEPAEIVRSFEVSAAECGGSMQSCTRAAMEALERALASMPAGVSEWRLWRPALFAHPLFERTALGCAYNREAAHGGDPWTVNPGASPHNERATHGASYRHVVDLGDPDASQFVIPGGQSENVLSDEYDNLLPLWSSGRYVPMQTHRYPTTHSLELMPPPPESPPDFVNQDQGPEE